MERPELRAADADRRRVVADLQQHYVDGRLSSDELDERVTRAMAARTFGELDALLRDLPPAPTRPEPEPPAVGEGPPEPRSRDGFRRHLTSYLLVMALLVAIWLLTDPGGYFWPIWPMLGWGFGLAWHALGRPGGDARPRSKDRSSCDHGGLRLISTSRRLSRASALPTAQGAAAARGAGAGRGRRGGRRRRS
jgi:hypothetical protein